MLQLFGGFVITIVSAIIFIRKFLHWKKYNTGYRESKKVNSKGENDYFHDRMLWGAPVFFLYGLYLIFNYFDN